MAYTLYATKRGTTTHDENKGKMVICMKSEKGRDGCYWYGVHGQFAVFCPAWQQKLMLLCD
jgi:hypothetical protein